MSEKRARIVERVEPARTPAEARQRRSQGMIGIGAVALLFGLVGSTSGSAVAVLIALLGIGLLVGGLVIRR